MAVGRDDDDQIVVQIVEATTTGRPDCRVLKRIIMQIVEATTTGSAEAATTNGEDGIDDDDQIVVQIVEATTTGKLDCKGDDNYSLES
ncbi:hypothetical protein TanjilG_20896 [Lupinus angustifolius]|uniref:Uncharacterized protein n=1 Tax=Lupinus angustifolius TaxID=3871 RepID=A0A1J7GK82_LUPAN|nr:hypothetical protein TanjilG_20896 [Lupinus angustifolius]